MTNSLLNNKPSGALFGNHPSLSYSAINKIFDTFSPSICLTLNSRFKDIKTIELISQRSDKLVHLFWDPLLICHELTAIYKFTTSPFVTKILLPSWVKSLNIFTGLSSSIDFYDPPKALLDIHYFSSSIALFRLSYLCNPIYIFGCYHEYGNSRSPNSPFFSDKSNAGNDYSPELALKEDKIWNSPNPILQEEALVAAQNSLTLDGCTVKRFDKDLSTLLR